MSIINSRTIGEAPTFTTEQEQELKKFNGVTNSTIYDLAGDIPVSSLTQFGTALKAGAATVTFWGDSITNRGNPADPVNEAEGTYVDLVKKQLTNAFPDVVFTFNNLGLGGRTSSQAMNVNYIGQATVNSSTGFAQSEANFTVTVGNSWLVHCKDTAPDLVILAFGMNPEQNGVLDDGLKNMDTEFKTWLKIPSVCVVPVMFPHTTKDRITAFNDLAEVYRFRGKKLKYGVLDINRVQQLLVAGKDIKRKLPFGSISLTDWVTKNGTVSGSNEDPRVFGADSSLVFVKKASDLAISVDFEYTDPATEGVFTITCREPRAPDIMNAQPPIICYINPANGALSVYAAGHLRLIKFLNITAGQHNITLTLDSDDFTLSHNGVAQGGSDIARASYRESDIEIGFVGGTTGGGIVHEVKTTALLPDSTLPTLSQDDVWGIPDGTNFTKYPYGGNGINHPSSLAIEHIYRPVFTELIRSAQLAYSK